MVGEKQAEAIPNAIVKGELLDDIQNISNLAQFVETRSNKHLLLYSNVTHSRLQSMTV